MRREPDYGQLHKERQDLCKRRNAAGASPTMPLRNCDIGTAREQVARFLEICRYQNYQIKGFLKEAFKALRRDPATACAKTKNYIGIIDGSIFVKPRKIRLELPEGTRLGTCQRPPPTVVRA